MTNNTPSGTKKHHESSKTRSHQTAKIFFFCRWASSKVCDSFTLVFMQNSTEQCTSPSLFHNFEVSRGDSD